ncbi:hypothetical protein E4634_20830 [Mangrovimicrobium sediminis]|uniref:Uncharacterized protein n=1 Tax=Mangrovimicrobium sediminis TaxID=2562682 RepID=A0A4Z0LUG6_9GAMM|nr:hypothetical protein [Haliea sp. SAOS-164]TGD70715.1 hypothetical protein E4634_20830 [Haliea sp. SAOS-164]
MSNSVLIKREMWPDVTDVPHFIVSLDYEGCSFHHDDIYFDEISEIVADLVRLNNSRKGEVKLNGGSRFSACIKAKMNGAIDILLHAESAASFPGKLSLEGVLQVEGENASSCISSLISLFEEGTPFAI